MKSGHEGEGRSQGRRRRGSRRLAVPIVVLVVAVVFISDGSAAGAHRSVRSRAGHERDSSRLGVRGRRCGHACVSSRTGLLVVSARRVTDRRGGGDARVLPDSRQASASSPTIDEFPTPTSGSGPEGIAAGPDGNVWFVEL